MSLTLADLSPEIRLLLACCHAQLNEARQAVLFAAVDAVRDWSRIPPLAREYRVSVLAHQHLKRYAIDQVPAAVMASLERQRQRAVRHNLLLVAELKRLVRDRLEPLGIPYLVFKGPVSAQAYYGDISLREARDLDVLIATPRLYELVEHLMEAGYQLVASGQSMSKAQLAACCHFLKDVSVRSPTGILIELHNELNNIISIYPLAPDWLLSHAKTRQLAGQEVRVMPSVDAVLYLCHHHSTHKWSRLHWLADLNVFFERHRETLQEIGERASVLGMSHLWESCRYLHGFLQGQADVNSPSIRASEMVSVMVDTLNGTIARPEVRASDSKLSVWSRLKYLASEEALAWRANPTWKARLRCLYYALRPTEPDIMWLDLPRPLYGLYWLIRPLRWLWELRRRELPPAHEHA